MSKISLAKHIPIMLVLALTLAACTDTASSVTPARKASGDVAIQRPQHDAGPQLSCNSATHLLYVSLAAANTVNIYPNPINGNPSPFAFITPSQGLNSPAGMILANNNSVLYVANTGAQNVLLFKKCGTGPGAVLNDAPFSPVDVAVSATFDVYVSNSVPPSVTVFPAGNPNYNPALTLSDSTARQGWGISIDKFGNCFWSFEDVSGVGRVDKFPGCIMPGATLALGGPSITLAGGVQLDFPQNRLLAVDQLTPAIRRFNPPSYTNVGAWVSTAGTMPVFLSLRDNEQRLYVADPLNGVVQRYKYPSGLLLAPITNGISAASTVTGVAVYPAAPL